MRGVSKKFPSRVYHSASLICATDIRHSKSDTSEMARQGTDIWQYSVLRTMIHGRHFPGL